MGRQVNFYASRRDTLEFQSFAKSVGLRVFPLLTTQFTSGGHDPNEDNLEAAPGAYLSPIPREQLHPYGDPPIRISGATDPLIQFIRSYYDAPYLVSGRIWYEPEDDEFGPIVRPHFNRLARWIRKHWRKRPDICDFLYFGPGAERLVDEEGAQPVSAHPDVPKRIVFIDDDKNDY